MFWLLDYFTKWLNRGEMDIDEELRQVKERLGWDWDKDDKRGKLAPFFLFDKKSCIVYRFLHSSLGGQNDKR